MRSINRNERKKEKTKKNILNTSIELFIQKNSHNVSFEEIANAADISRKTLYNHFNNKEDLLNTIIIPIFKDGDHYIDLLVEDQAITINSILSFCLFLWKKYGTILNLLNNIDFAEYTDLENNFNSFIDKFCILFERSRDIPDNYALSSRELSYIVFNNFIPLLTSIYNLPDYERKFNNSMLGLIKGLYND